MTKREDNVPPIPDVIYDTNKQISYIRRRFFGKVRFCWL